MKSPKWAPEWYNYHDLLRWLDDHKWVTLIALWIITAVSGVAYLIWHFWAQISGGVSWFIDLALHTEYNFFHLAFLIADVGTAIFFGWLIISEGAEFEIVMMLVVSQLYSILGFLAVSWLPTSSIGFTMIVLAVQAVLIIVTGLIAYRYDDPVENTLGLVVLNAGVLIPAALICGFASMIYDEGSQSYINTVYFWIQYGITCISLYKALLDA